MTRYRSGCGRSKTPGRRTRAAFTKQPARLRAPNSAPARASGASNELARALVAAGIADAPMEVRQVGIDGALIWRSFHARGAVDPRRKPKANRYGAFGGKTRPSERPECGEHSAKNRGQAMARGYLSHPGRLRPLYRSPPMPHGFEAHRPPVHFAGLARQYRHPRDPERHPRASDPEVGLQGHDACRAAHRGGTSIPRKRRRKWSLTRRTARAKWNRIEQPGKPGENYVDVARAKKVTLDLEEKQTSGTG